MFWYAVCLERLWWLDNKSQDWSADNVRLPLCARNGNRPRNVPIYFWPLLVHLPAAVTNNTELRPVGEKKIQAIAPLICIDDLWELKHL
jgi:hypothetical protein